MAFAVVHVIIPIIAVDLVRDFVLKKKFSTFFLLIAGFAGLLPDADIPISWAVSFLTGTSVDYHRIFTHTLLFPLIFLVIAAIFHFVEKKNYKIFKFSIQKHHVALFFLMLAIGWSFHVMLDCFFAADGSLSFIPGVPLNMCPHAWSNDAILGLDAILLLGWLFREQLKHNIKDYI